MNDELRAGRDWWPLTRLLTVGLVFGLLAHWRLGWNPHLRDLWAVPGGLATIFLFIVALSSSLAHICLVVAAIPFCGVILLNDWLYDAAAWTCRTVLRVTSRWTLAFGGLCGEIILFTGLAYALRALALRF